jgi:hypothetical protein
MAGVMGTSGCLLAGYLEAEDDSRGLADVTIPVRRPQFAASQSILSLEHKFHRHSQPYGNSLAAAPGWFEAPLFDRLRRGVIKV